MADVRNNPDDPQALDEIAAALDEADGVDATRISLSLQDATVVLSGVVASAEEASAAALIAEQLSDAVRNEIAVDPQVREDSTHSDAGAQEVVDDSSQRETDLATSEHGGELTTDMHEALAENIPLDPPDEPVMVPTLAEERGVAAEPTSEPIGDSGPLSQDEADQTAPSLADMSPADLARAARQDAGQDEEQ